MKRRRFLQTAATLAVGIQIVPRYVLGQGQTPPSEKLNIAGVGIGGQGGGVLNDMKSENIVALCDVDWAKAAGTFQAFPNAERFKDYRVMLEKRKDIDAVMVATPDHMHAPIALAALRAGKHVYVEKPMAHSIEEARVMTKVAQETGLVTQMGNNGHAGEGLRLTREWIQAGAIGAVREVHGWSDRAGNWWKQPAERPVDVLPVPADLDWDLWLGCAPQRPYHKAYHPFAWRGWFDFGTGALGDMAVHNLDPAFYALDLGAPLAAQAQDSGLGQETYAAWQIITFEFAARGAQPALKMVWYDGGKLPQKAWRPRGRSGTFRQRHPVHRRAGIDVVRWLVRPTAALSRQPAQGVSTPAQDDSAFQRASCRVDSGVQGQETRGCQGWLRLLRSVHRGVVGRQPRRALAETRRVGLGQPVRRNAPEAEALIRKSYRAGFGI